jgi:hypothetical protein
MNDTLDIIARDLMEFSELQIRDPEAAKKKVEEWREHKRNARRMNMTITREDGGFQVVIHDPNSGAAGMGLGMFVPEERLVSFITGGDKVLDVFGKAPDWA